MIRFLLLFLPVCTIVCAVTGGMAQAQKIDSLKRLLKTEQREAVRVQLYNGLGDAYSNQNFDSSLYYFGYAIDISKKLKVDSLLAQTYSRVGRVCILIGNSEKGMEYLFESLKLFEKTGHKRNRIAVLNNIALIYYRNNDLERALQEFLEIEQLANENKTEFGKFYYTLCASLYNNIGIIYENKKQYDKALDTYMKGLNMAQHSNDKVNKANLYVNIAKTYQFTKQYTLAETNFEEAMRLRKEDNDKYGVCRSLGHLGSLYLALGNFTKAQEFLEQCLTMSRELGSLDTEANTAQVLMEVYQKQNKFEQALKMLQLYKALDDSLRNDGVARRLVQVEMQYEFEKKQQEAQAAQERKELIFYITAGILVSVSVITVLLYFLQRSRANNEKLQKDNLALANSHLTLEKKTLEENLEFKNKELTTNVMYLMKKNEMLIDVSERLMEVKRNARKEDQDRIQKIIVELNTAQDNDVWEEFEVRFNQVYNDFYERLMAKFPNLSSNDRKLCAFLRLNMSSKEICAITRQNPNSLNVARARLRKKLGIDNPETSLVSFLEQV